VYNIRSNLNVKPFWRLSGHSLFVPFADESSGVSVIPAFDAPCHLLPGHQRSTVTGTASSLSGLYATVLQSNGPSSSVVGRRRLTLGELQAEADGRTSRASTRREGSSSASASSDGELQAKADGRTSKSFDEARGLIVGVVKGGFWAFTAFCDSEPKTAFCVHLHSIYASSCVGEYRTDTD
jgi:hypothetical protein